MSIETVLAVSLRILYSYIVQKLLIQFARHLVIAVYMHIGIAKVIIKSLSYSNFDSTSNVLIVSNLFFPELLGRGGA